MFEDTSWLELGCFFVLSTGISIPVLVEGKYVIRGETADFSLVEPTVVQLMKTFRHFISYIENKLNGNIVAHVKLKSCTSAARLCWSQRPAGMTGRPWHDALNFMPASSDLRRQLATKTSMKRPNLSSRPDL